MSSARETVALVLRLGFAFALGAAFVTTIVRSVDVMKVARLLEGAATLPLVAGAAAYSVGFVLRIARFHNMLQAASERPVAWRACVAPYIASFGISDILPFRAGEAFRIAWFSRMLGLPKGRILGIMLVERVLDLCSVVVLGGIALTLARVNEPALVSGFSIVGGAALAIVVGMVLAPTIAGRLPRTIRLPLISTPASAILGVSHNIAAALTSVGSQRRLLVFAGMSLACWMFEGMVFVAAWFSLGGSLKAVAAPVLAFASSILGTILPSLPGHFGSFEYFGVRAFGAAGVDAPLGTAVVFLAHLVLWVPSALFGILWLATRANRWQTLGKPLVRTAA